MFKKSIMLVVCFCLLMSAGVVSAVDPVWSTSTENDTDTTNGGGSIVSGPSNYVAGAYGNAFAGNASVYANWTNTAVAAIFDGVWVNSAGSTVDLFFRGNHWSTHSGDSGFWSVTDRLGGHDGYIMMTVRNGKLRFPYKDSYTGYGINPELTSITLTNDVTYRLTARQQGTNFEVYLDDIGGSVYSNAAPIYTTTFSQTISFPAPNTGSPGRTMNVGNRAYFGGLLQTGEWVDEIRVYNGYYTPAEIGLPSGPAGPDGDVDGDGIVDLTDLMIMAENWLLSGGTSGQGNLDLSGLIDLSDYAILANDWLAGALIVIETQPESVVEAEGQTATFTVAASGAAPISYQWQKNTIDLEDGGKISGAEEASLEITNIDDTDEGSYRCVVSNNYNSETSDTVTLTVVGSGLAGQWPLDDNAASTVVVDSTGNNLNGTFVDATGNPNTSAHHSATCQEGTGSLIFDGVDDYVTMTRSTAIEVGNPSTHELSVSAWVKSDLLSPPSTFSTIVGTGDGGWYVGSFPNQDKLYFACWLTSGYTATVTDDTPVFDGQWHHVVAVYDGSKVHIYVDGNHGEASYSGTIRNMFDQPVLLGENAHETGRKWDGLIDDVSIYTSALSSEDVYHEINPNYAWNPYPVDGADSVSADSTDLSWSPGELAESHDVYLGTDSAAVVSATTSSGEYQGNQTSTVFDATLADDTDYYWRVDEVTTAGAGSTWTGRLWSFTTKVAVGRQTLTESTTSRRYILYVPTDYSSNQAYPLIISSHGTSQNGDTEMDSTGPNNGFDNGTPTWPTLAEDNDVIVACPDMTGAYGYPDWTPGQLTQLAADDTAIMAIISEIEGVYNIDTNNIMLTGFSGGGHVVHYVGLRHADVFKATCARHGNFNTAEVPSPLPSGTTDMPVYIFTGSNDTTSGPPESIAWYTAQGFGNLDTDTFTTYPSSEHTTDRHHAMNWFMGLKIGVSASGHYVTYKGDTLMLVGDSGTQCAAQNSNLNHRQWIDDCHSRGIRTIHVWAFIPARQKQDGSVVENRWGYVYPDVVPWARNTSGSLANDQKYDWNLQAFDEGATGDFTHYWPRMRDMASYAKSKGMLLGVTIFTGWTKDSTVWSYHPLNVNNGGHLSDNGDAVTIASPGTEVWQETYSSGWSNAKKTQWVWEKLCIKFIDDLGSMGNVFFVFFDEHSYDDGNMETHFCNFFTSRGMMWVDEEDVRSITSWVMSGTFTADDRNSHATSGFVTTPVRPYFNLEGGPYMGDEVREAIWTFSVGGGHYIFHGDEDQETDRTGIMGYDPYVPGGDKGMYKRDWVGYASRFFNEYVSDLDSMTPWNGLVSSGAYCLAQPGTEYAVYSKDGYSTITVNLSAAAGKTLDCRFYDPRDGLFNATFQRTGGSSSESFTKPSSDDWILHILNPVPSLVTDHLVAHLTFDEGSGTSSSDLTGNGHNANLVDTTWGSGYVTIAGSSIETSMAAIATSSLLMGTTFSWDLWFEASSSTSGEARICSQASDIGGVGPEMFERGSSRIGIRINNEGTVFNVPTVGTRSNAGPPDHWGISADSFHRGAGPEHVVYIHDPATKTVRVFLGLEGQPLKLTFEATYTGSYDVESVAFALGNVPAGNRQFDGCKYYQFAYYNDMLTYQVDGSRNVTGGEVYQNHLAGSDNSTTGQPPVITEVTPDPDTTQFAGIAYTKQLQLTQGDTPVAWSVVQGPTGIQVGSSTGYVDGWTPGGCDVGESVTIEIRAQNVYGFDTETWHVEPKLYYMPDNIANLSDLMMMAEEWLATSGPMATDLDCSGSIDLVDFATLGQVWLEEQEEPELAITNVNRTSYVVSYDSLAVGQLVYVDRTYTFTNVASLGGSTYIKTANNDKYATGDSFLTFDINRNCTVYCAHDDGITAKPSWMSSWTDTGGNFTFSGSTRTFSLYSKSFSTGTVTIGGNAGDVSSSMYMVVVVEQ